MIDRRTFLASALAVGGSLMLKQSAFGQETRASSSQPSSAASSSAAQAMLIRTAASQYLATLSPRQSSKATFAFPLHETAALARFARSGGGPGSGGGRGGNSPVGNGPGGGRPGGPGGGSGGFIGEKFGASVWSNFPVSDVIRPGLRMGELTPAERDAAHHLLQSVLSPMGYQKILDIMAADQVLADQGTPYASEIDTYTLALFGKPDAGSPWMLQFGGHHLGLNVTFVGDKAVCAPLHTGILPSKFEKAGKTVRGLGRENDRAFHLVESFTAEQVKKATIDHEVSELVCGPGRPDATFSSVGLKGSEMSQQQQAVMFTIAREWAGMLNDAQAASRFEEIQKSLPDTYFAWSGPTTHEPDMNGESYFRVHGPSLLIEHAPQNNQGGYKWHVHTVMRDIGNDYAKRLV